ncbi:iron-sulfur cluster assembly scaffold protein [Novispirillum sp. DQ9]|uniref:iron-sulfur cluster assembly scaffold protein n=1 Tax=Novispirillum sp. DQ9 TaxID=3398612 RepID=UPI003C7E1ACF
MLDPALIDLYSKRLKEWGATIKEDRPLPAGTAHGSARRRSPLCGSQITFDVALDDAGTIAAIGWTVRACALSEAAAGIVVHAAPGCGLEDLKAVRDAMRRMLREESDDLPGGKWADLEILKPAQMVRSRHGSAMLPFETIVEAVEAALENKAAS